MTHLSEIKLLRERIFVETRNCGGLLSLFRSLSVSVLKAFSFRREDTVETVVVFISATFLPNAIITLFFATKRSLSFSFLKGVTHEWLASSINQGIDCNSKSMNFTRSEGRCNYRARYEIITEWPEHAVERPLSSSSRIFFIVSAKVTFCFLSALGNNFEPFTSYSMQFIIKFRSVDFLPVAVLTIFTLLAKMPLSRGKSRFLTGI